MDALRFIKELLFLDHVVRDSSNDKLKSDTSKYK